MDEKALHPTLVTVLCQMPVLLNISKMFVWLRYYSVTYGLACVIYMIPKGVNVNVSFRIHNSQKNEKEQIEKESASCDYPSDSYSDSDYPSSEEVLVFLRVW